MNKNYFDSRSMTKMHYLQSSGTTGKKFGTSHAVLVFILYYLIIAGSDVFISSLGSNFVSSLADNTEAFQVLIKLVGFLAGLFLSGLVIFYLFKQYFFEPLVEVGLVKSSIPWYLVALGVGITASILMKTIGYSDLMHMNEEKRNPYEGLNEAGLSLKILYVCAIGFCGPFIEEFIFRGVLYKGFSSSLGKVAGAIVVSGIFIVVHTTILQFGSWFIISILILVAVLLILFREFSGSLIPPILIHQSYNLGLLIN